MFLRILNADAVADVHYLISHQIPNPPTFVHCKFFDVGNKICINLIHGKRLREINNAVDALHSYGILVVLVNIAEYLKQVLFRHMRNQLDHILQHH